MGKKKLLLTAILLVNCWMVSSIAQDSIKVNSNQNGLIQYTTKTDSNAHIFVLYGDGHFGIQHQPQHKFAASSAGYVTEAYFVKAYDTNLPPKRTLSTDSVGSGSNYTNPSISMSGEVDLMTSWATASGYENYFIVAFKNANSTSAVSGCVEFYFNNSEITLNASGIKEYNSWVTNRSLSTISSGSYDRKLSWSFSSLQKDEVRYIYVPATVKKNSGTRLNLMTNYQVSCTGSGTSKSSTFLVRRFPHDPNFKIVNRECLKPFVPEQRLEYTIGFFNDGHDFARDVMVRDTLMHLLDPNTIDILDYEYQPNWWHTGPFLHFDFHHINLPGTNQTIPQAYSYEDAFTYITFAICTAPNLNLNTCIINDAAITFDQQPTFITEPAVICTDAECMDFEPCLGLMRSSTKPSSPLEQGISMNISPNPFTDKINVSVGFNGLGGKRFVMEIVSISGKVVRHISQSESDLSSFNQQFSLGDLPPGIYILTLQTDHGRYHRKLIRQ